tara:strand:- start:516 stop:689 length:174 start_codon:yes stop_codon:yes gene_type:complete
VAHGGAPLQEIVIEEGVLVALVTQKNLLHLLQRVTLILLVRVEKSILMLVETQLLMG